MDFEFYYHITYEDGQKFIRQGSYHAHISKDDYRKIVLGVLAGTPIEKIDDIPDALNEIREVVLLCDRYTNLNGSMRNTPLKKNRKVSELHYFMPEREISRFRTMSNPIDVLERPAESMKLFRTDGSYIEIVSELGKVTVTDSKKRGTSMICDADQFISQLTR